MNAGKELIHRLMDGGLAAEEQDRIRREIASDPDLAAELRRMEEVTHLLSSGRSLSPGAGFTEAVMGRLPEAPQTFGGRVRSFLLGERILRWNLARAALAALVIAGAFFAVRFIGPPETRQEADRSGVTVTFRVYAPQASQVALAGEFNRWQPDATMLEPEGKGFWSAQLSLAPGTYTYMFVLNGTQWVTDPEAGLYRDDGFGYRNAVLQVDHL